MSEHLTDGPRGRRLLLELAREADPEIGQAMFDLSYNAAVDSGAAIARFGWNEDGTTFSDDSRRPVAARHSVSEVAARIRALGRLEPTSEVLVEALRRSVDVAAYWQPPDGDDLVIADAGIRAALRAVGAHVPARADAAWWRRARTSEQWTVEWDASGDGAPFDPAPGAAAAWRDRTVAEEERARRERPSDPAANFSGDWWSHPWGAPRTTGVLPSGVPAGIPLVEDSLGWTRALAVPISGTGRTLEVRAARDWAELCRAYPLEVTASRRHDWYRTTGRAGRWLLPDWSRVAAEWDTVHLSAWAYLTTAGRALEIDDEYASVIAGWGPDETFWLTGGLRERDELRVSWRRARNDVTWERV